jgi:hypothetical protein
VNGSQTLTVPAFATGDFEDTVHSDSLVIDDLFNYKITCNGGDGTGYITILRQLMTGTPVIGASGLQGIDPFSLFGQLGWNGLTRAEWALQYKMSIPAVLAKARVYCNLNLGSSNNSISRKNGGDGNINIALAGGTGWFEDIVNSDSLVAGDLINGLEIGDLHTILAAHYTLDSAKKPLVAGGQGPFFSPGTQFNTIEGSISLDANEDNEKVLAGEDRALTFLYVSIIDNAFTGYVTVKTRINSMDGLMSLTVPAGTLGHFQNVSPLQEGIISSDYIDYVSYTGGGVIYCVFIGVCESPVSPSSNALGIPQRYKKVLLGG